MTRTHIFIASASSSQMQVRQRHRSQRGGRHVGGVADRVGVVDCGVSVLCLCCIVLCGAQAIRQSMRGQALPEQHTPQHSMDEANNILVMS